MQNYVRLRNSFAEIHLGNLRHNFETIRSALGPDQLILPMVKANAYGHGDVEIARCLSDWGADGLGVALIEEGIRLRQAGVGIPILTFSFFDSIGAEAIVKFNLTPVLSTWDQIEKLNRQLADQLYFPVHLKFNTGMARLGFDVKEATKLRDYFRAQSMLKVEGICTHLLNAADSTQSEGHTERQLQHLTEVESAFADLHPRVHLLSSGAIGLRLKGLLHSPLSSKDVLGARPGLSLYGIWPLAVPPKDLELRPVMALKTQIVHVHKLKAGESVSYGAAWTATTDTTIGVVPLGYADGYPRSLSNKSEMFIAGRRVPVRGTVCMDYTMVDLSTLTGSPEKLVGQEVIAFGGESGIPIQEIANLTGTIPYEIMTGVSARVPRIFVH